ncbi:CD276 antigen-like [Chiloscyllium punctatum]|uniref:CD276 antigen-like n=1 Tax=Chiloscyllium punctatum TaxID=137246 RepID=UPI003B637021
MPRLLILVGSGSELQVLTVSAVSCWNISAVIKGWGWGRIRNSSCFKVLCGLQVDPPEGVGHSDSPVPVSGFLGEQVVLPYIYKGNVQVSDLQIIWGTPRSEIVHKFVDGNDDFREQDPRFRNRTKLFKDQLEQGNWSVLTSDLRETDQDEYQCQIYSKMGDRFRWLEVVSVHLSVTERAPTPGPNTPVPGDSPVPVSGFLGEQVVLLCTYKGNIPVSDLLVIWGTPKSEMVHEFVNGIEDLRKQDPWFRNRTNLFKDQLEQGNWSVLTSDLRETDQDEYQCQIYSKMEEHFHHDGVVSVHLSVRDEIFLFQVFSVKSLILQRQ